MLKRVYGKLKKIRRNFLQNVVNGKKISLSSNNSTRLHSGVELIKGFQRNKQGWILSHSEFVQNNKIYKAFSFDKRNIRGVGVHLFSDIRWFRFEQPFECLKNRTYVIEFEYRFLKATETEPDLNVKILKYRDGKCGIFEGVSLNLPQSDDFTRFSHEFMVGNIEDTECEYRLTFELKSRGLLEIRSVKVSHENLEALSGQYIPPYRKIAFPVSDRLRKINDNMQEMLSDEPIVWLSEMLQVSLGLEDYETAEGLVSYILTYIPMNENNLKRVSGLILKVYIALGQIDEMKSFLNLMSNHQILFDEAVSVSSRLFEERLGADAYILPSGKIDIFNVMGDLSKNIKIPTDVLLKASAQSSEPELIWANAYVFSDEKKYIENLNKFIKSKKGNFNISLSDFDENILKRVRFRGDISFGNVKEGPVVTIIMACYNCEDTIEYALKSILDQTYENIEILIGDDNSSDMTVEKIQPFLSDPRVRLFVSSENQGPYNIRNHLISISKGSYITFHDADDLAFPHRIALQLRDMISKDAVASMGRMLRMAKNGSVIAFVDGLSFRQCMVSLMFRREMFDQFGPYRSVLCGADSEFYEKMRGVYKDKVIMINTPLFLVLWGGGSLTKTSGIEANEMGYRAPARRVYSALVGRQRILGDNCITNAQIDLANKEFNIYKKPQIMNEQFQKENAVQV